MPVFPQYVLSEPPYPAYHGVSSPLFLADLEAIPFEAMPAEGETQGVARNARFRYRHGRFAAIDRGGVERHFKVQCRSDGQLTIEDLGKTRAQHRLEEKDEYDRLSPATLAILASLNLPPITYLPTLTALGNAIEGRPVRGSLSAAVQCNRALAIRLKELCPTLNTVDDLARYLRSLASP